MQMFRVVSASQDLLADSGDVFILEICEDSC
jgi:hypothetical protein